ncbi:hypothetical protein M9H77_06811 [Catharanthus roseus]|uniref:Uncharacterized protein n=1 Tax=Catharanthus roseus TaxID=4058 RepID=A0ACC0BT90_CATRO|nr:hypothetical protein M9H77_06811 [Catharanthus roseus]
MNKDLQTIISTIKGVRTILDRACLAIILRIPDNGIFAFYGVNFAGERRLSTGPHQVIQFTKFNNYQCDEENQVRINPSEEDKLWGRFAGDFRPIKKTTKIDIGASSSQ